MMWYTLVLLSACIGSIVSPPSGSSNIHSSEGYCSFTAGDYKPNDQSMADLGRLPVPKFQTDILNNVAGISGKVGRHAAAGMHGINLVKAVFGTSLPQAFIKSQPVLAPILGVVGAAMGFEVANNDDSKARLLAQTKEALEQLSEQVDRKFDNMQHYVEGNFVQKTKEDTVDELNQIFASFANCGERHDDEAIDRCNREKSFTMDEKMGKFLFSESKFESNSNLNILETKKMEATLPITRDYVFKYLLMLQNHFVREQLLEENDLHYFEVFTRKIIENIPTLARYARWAYRQIIRTHTTGNCDDMQCGSFRDEGDGKDTKRCTCHMDKTDMTRLCTVILKYTKSRRDQQRKVSSEGLGRESLERRRRRYVSAIRSELESFWRKEILDPVESWETTKTKMEESRENYPDLTDDDSGEAEDEDEDEE